MIKEIRVFFDEIKRKNNLTDLSLEKAENDINLNKNRFLQKF